jgi:hypothetical protein
MLCDTDADAKGSAFHVGRRRSPGAPAEAFNLAMPPNPAGQTCDGTGRRLEAIE